jgi:hypothetical protein
VLFEKHCRTQLTRKWRRACLTYWLHSPQCWVLPSGRTHQNYKLRIRCGECRPRPRLGGRFGLEGCLRASWSGSKNSTWACNRLSRKVIVTFLVAATCARCGLFGHVEQARSLRSQFAHNLPITPFAGLRDNVGLKGPVLFSKAGYRK